MQHGERDSQNATMECKLRLPFSTLRSNKSTRLLSHLLMAILGQVVGDVPDLAADVLRNRSIVFTSN